MKYNDITLGQVEAVFNKLGGMDGVQRFLSGEMVVKEGERKWNIWRTIKLGIGPRNADEFRKAIKGNGMKIGDYADNILGKPTFTVATEEIEIDLVLVTVAKLGFKKRATREDIYKRAKELGLELCPAEVGPQLRLQYKDQPNGEWILVGMEPIADRDGDLEVFGAGRNDFDLWLRSSFYGDPGNFWVGSSHWVFGRPRK